MFISKEEVESVTGIAVDQQTLTIAQLMIETWVGKSEAEVENNSDFLILGRATLLQAAFVNGDSKLILEQAAVTSIVNGATTTHFDTSLFSPYMSPWAIKACARLSWMGTRSIKTGPVFDTPKGRLSWETV